MKKKNIIIVALMLMLGTSYFMKNTYIPNSIVKTAVKENELSGKNYILCQRARTTGFDWLMVKNEANVKTNEFCNIIGSNPFDELYLRHELVMARNTYVFYINEKTITYSEELQQDIIEYTATGWDILYPVKRDDVASFFSSKKYITGKDLWEDEP